MSETQNQQHQPNLREGATAQVIGIPKIGEIKPTVPLTLKAQRLEPEAFKQSLESVGKIQIKPFVDKNRENMGLENYNMAVFPGTHHEEQIAAIEINGVVRFITGLDEFSPEVQNISDDEERASIIHNIRNIVVHLEKLLATNVLDPKDSDFWNKVKVVRPNNLEFWSKVSIRCGNDALVLEPSKDPMDLIKFMAIEAGGFNIVAKSYEDALSRSVAPRFYLDKETSTVSVKTSYKRLRNKAIGILDKIALKDPRKLMYIAKTIDTNSTAYKNSTPIDILYDALDEYIAGSGIEANKTKAAEYFITISELDMETLKLRALVKDASFYRFIVPKADGMLYHMKTAVMLGRSVSDVVIYLKNPLNDDMLLKLMGEVEQYWNK